MTQSNTEGKARRATGASPSAVGPWERKRARTSLEIEWAGLALLRERGVQNVTVEQVAAAAGISTRTFFRYFRNVPDLLTAVPIRETERMCRRVAARPQEEDVVEAFRAVYEQPDEAELESDDAHLEHETATIWSAIARREPETVSAQSGALTVMVAGFQEVVRTRLRLQGRDDELTAGVLAAALAGVIWFVFLGWISGDRVGSLSQTLGSAFERLRDLMQLEARS